MVSTTTFAATEPDAVSVADLTHSERRVLALLACGSAPKQVAWDLHVSVATVRAHIASAKRKCGARTLHQLVAMFVAAYGARP